MKQELAQDIALMRYSMISPLIVGLPDEYRSKEAYFRAASARGALHPNGSFIHPAPTSIKRWYQHYQKNGFDALLPSGRSDEGTSRKIDPDLEEQIRYLKTTYPRMSAAAVFRQLCTNGSTNRNELSESTVNRFLNNLALKEKTTNNQDMRRYERAHVNEVWCGDSSVGPYLKTEDGKRHKVYVIALIDDASRYIVGIDVFFNDNFVNLMSVMKSAVAKFGVPKLFNFDNGSSYKNKQMDLLAARIGSTVHCYPAPLVLQIILISVKLNEGTDSDILMFFTAECLNRYLLVLSYQSYKNSRYLPDQSLTPAIITIQCTTTSLDREMMHQRHDNNYSTF